MKKFILLLLIISYSCKTEIITNSYNANYNNKNQGASKTLESSNSTVLYFIRHAETVNDNTTSNPSLSKIGQNRAKSFITFFEDKRLDSVFTTNFKRTLQTAIPVAESKNIKPVYYDPNAIDYADFIKQQKGKKVLIVGHSNTTPNFVNKIIGSMKYSQMVHENHSDIFKVVINRGKISEEVFVLEVELQKIAKAKAILEEKRLKAEKKRKRKEKRRKKKSVFD